MITPRNSLVVLRLIEQAEKKIGQITVPTNKELFSEAEVVAVGPGTVSAEGGRSETFDLKVGQRVFVKSKDRFRGQVGEEVRISGIEYRVGDEKFYIFEQGNVLGIIADVKSDVGMAVAVSSKELKQLIGN